MSDKQNIGDKLQQADQHITEHVVDDGSIRTWKRNMAPAPLRAVFADEPARHDMIFASPPGWGAPEVVSDGEQHKLKNGWTIGAS